MRPRRKSAPPYAEFREQTLRQIARSQGLPPEALQFSRTRTVPRAALRFAATLDELKKSETGMSDDPAAIPPDDQKQDGEFAEGDPPAADKPAEEPAAADPLAPLTVPAVIRTADVVMHPYWGRCVNDLAGFTPPEGPEPVDYCHNSDEVIGFGDAWQVDAAKVACNVTLVPHTAEDRASEIITKGNAGVPYEASVLLDEASLVIEEVSEGASTEVNGQTIQGPVVVFRQWRINGLAVCPQGVDGGTSLTFPGAPEASVQVQEPAAAETPPAAPAPEGSFSDDPPAAEPKKDEPAGGFSRRPDAALQFTPAEGRKFLTAFGQQGAVWFAQGLTFDQARAKFSAGLQADNVKLRAENEQLKRQLAEAEQKLGFHRGQSSPLSFMPGTRPADPAQAGQPSPAQFASLGTNLARFAASLKFTKPAAK